MPRPSVDAQTTTGPTGVSVMLPEARYAEHAYALQFCLYSLALHRLLSVRLPGYVQQRHFGGVFYLYLRGVAPAPRATPARRPNGARRAPWPASTP